MNRSRWILAAFLLLGVVTWTFVSGCGSSDPAGPGGGGNGGGGAGTLSNTLTGVQTQFFGGANEAVFNSLAFLGPLVENLGVRIAGDEYAADGASLVSCLVDSLVGVVFDYVGGQYVSTGLTGAPADGARFLLYEVDALGVVNTANQIGHLDVVCTPGGLAGQVNMTILVVIGGTTVVDLTLSGTHPVSTIISINPGSITSSDGATTLQVSGSVDDASAGDSLTDAYWMALGMDNLTPTLGAGFHEWENLATGRKEYWIIVADFGQALSFEAQVNLQVDALDNITSGTARYTEGFETFTVACISGTLDDPVVTANAGACTVAETVPGAYPLGDLDDIKLTFQAFRSMHGAVKGLVKAALALVAVPAQ